MSQQPSPPAPLPPLRERGDSTFALGRAELYNFLAAVFSEPPDVRWIAGLRDGRLVRVLAIVAAPAEIEALTAWATCGDLAQRHEELARAYTRLLVVPGPGYIPPYGSVYRDGPDGPPGTWLGRPTLWGPSSVAVAQAYREAGLALAPDGPQVPDHLGLELQFMHHLCACEAEALSQGEVARAAAWRARQAVFLRTHLLPWAPAFCARVDAEGIHLFYRLLARLTRAFLESEGEEVAR